MIYYHFNLHRMFRHPKTKSEKTANANSEYASYIRAKRRVNNLPDSWWDLYRCKDNDTKRQKRRSQRNFRQSIRYFDAVTN